MKNFYCLLAAVVAGIGVSGSVLDQEGADVSTVRLSGMTASADIAPSASPRQQRIRFATFNVALNRGQPGELIRTLRAGRSRQLFQLAEIIQRVRPDILLLNEVDHDAAGEAVRLWQEKYLAVGQNGQRPIRYPYRFTAEVNTGVASGVDMNQDGKIGLPDDGFGFGAFPGQYGMVVLSRYPVDQARIRTFQKFLWKDMPDAQMPRQPGTGDPFYPAGVWEKIRLSSKSHWDIPIVIGEDVVHLVCAHPTPPVFDGPEDRNGKRNHDEIRLIADYISGEAAYLYDDRGRRGGLPAGSHFVVAGDLNADPCDGDSFEQAARLLTRHPDIHHSLTPSSTGAVEAAGSSGGRNRNHRGPPAHDTGDFNDERVGNVRVDYCLPSRNLKLLDGGVFWPASDQAGHELNEASDHHLVWIDVTLD